MNADLADDLDDVKEYATSPKTAKGKPLRPPFKKPPIDSKIRSQQQKPPTNSQYSSLRKSQEHTSTLNVANIRKETEKSKAYLDRISVVEAKRQEILKQLDKDVSIPEARNNVKKIMNTEINVDDKPAAKRELKVLSPK